jgi:hypothetical protein
MGRAAGFHTNQAGGQIFEKGQKLGSSQLSVRKHLVTPVDHVHLEKPFRDIYANYQYGHSFLLCPRISPQG